MERRGIDNEHSKTGANQDTDKVVLVVNDVAAEWIFDFRFDGEGVEALVDEDREIDDGLGLAKRVNLMCGVYRLATVVDEVRARLGEVH